ncbi:hypothetical protein YC2023_069851 [Brassica napus]
MILHLHDIKIYAASHMRFLRIIKQLIKKIRKKNIMHGKPNKSYTSHAWDSRKFQY